MEIKNIHDYKLKDIILIFASGKMVCSGGKTGKDVYRTVNNIHSMLEENEIMIYE